MSQMGFTKMMHVLLEGDGRTVEVFRSCIGKCITDLQLTQGEYLLFAFTDGTKMKLWDDGQSCCETRYMTTDDDLTYFVGATLTNADIADAPSIPHEYGEHDVQFLHIYTNRGSFTMETHNEHNGYYGGFVLKAKIIDGN